MNKLVVGNLVHRPLRSLISVLAVAIEVIMILSITAILMGKLNGFKTRQNGIGMDMIVRPELCQQPDRHEPGRRLDQGGRRAGEAAACDRCGAREHADQQLAR